MVLFLTGYGQRIKQGLTQVCVCKSATRKSWGHEEVGHTSFVFQNRADDVQLMFEPCPRSNGLIVIQCHGLGLMLMLII